MVSFSFVHTVVRVQYKIIYKYTRQSISNLIGSFIAASDGNEVHDSHWHGLAEQSDDEPSGVVLAWTVEVFDEDIEPRLISHREVTGVDCRHPAGQHQQDCANHVAQ